MSQRRTLGAGVPANWTVDVAQALILSRNDNVLSEALSNNFGLRNTPDFRSVNVDLAMAPMRTGDWPVVDQKHRGTCTAFAVTAAEEAWYFHNSSAGGQKGTVVPLSKEYLYSGMQAHSYFSIGIHLEEEKEKRFLAAGATYLLQAIRALEATGVCEERLAEYDTDSNLAENYSQNTFSQDAHADAQNRRPTESNFFHNIVELERSPSFPLKKVWRKPHDGVPTSQILRQALAENSPVVAAFAILNEPGEDAWFKNAARLCGTIRYPSDEDISGLKVNGGHTVCLLGYVRNESAADDGVFIFRNSYGVSNFAGQIDAKKCYGNILDWKGFGTISMADVDRYCWEYMYRAPNAI